jgi:CRISPR-associated exonuclease Cas4
MNLTVVWIALAALLGLFLGLWLMVAGRGIRQRRGLGTGKTMSLDKIVLRSARLGLTGTPNRLIRTGNSIIIEEWKSSKTLRPSHRAQMGVYFLLVEEQFRIRPTHAFIVCGDGSRHRIENDELLRAWVWEMVAQIKAARSNVGQPIPVKPAPGQCRKCGMRFHCSQARP